MSGIFGGLLAWVLANFHREIGGAALQIGQALTQELARHPAVQRALLDFTKEVGQEIAQEAVEKAVKGAWNGGRFAFSTFQELLAEQMKLRGMRVPWEGED